MPKFLCAHRAYSYHDSEFDGSLVRKAWQHASETGKSLFCRSWVHVSKGKVLYSLRVQFLRRKSFLMFLLARLQGKSIFYGSWVHVYKKKRLSDCAWVQVKKKSLFDGSWTGLHVSKEKILYSSWVHISKKCFLWFLSSRFHGEDLFCGSRVHHALSSVLWSLSASFFSFFCSVLVLKFLFFGFVLFCLSFVWSPFYFVVLFSFLVHPSPSSRPPPLSQSLSMLNANY